MSESAFAGARAGSSGFWTTSQADRRLPRRRGRSPRRPAPLRRRRAPARRLAAGSVSPWRVPSGGGFRLEARMNDGAVARQRGRLDDLVVPVDRKRLGFLVDQYVEKGKEVPGV